MRRALRQALRGLRQAAESYGERDVAEFVASHNDDVVRLDARALDSLDEVAAMLAQPGTAPGTLGRAAPRAAGAARSHPARPRRRQLRRRTVAPRSHSARLPHPTLERAVTAGHDARRSRRPSLRRRRCRRSAIAPPPLPIAEPAASAPARGEPASSARCSTPGSRKLGTLRTTPLAHAGRASPSSRPCRSTSCSIAAARRSSACREIRDQVRSAGGPVDAETLGELFDLLDLALTD